MRGTSIVLGLAAMLLSAGLWYNTADAQYRTYGGYYGYGAPGYSFSVSRYGNPYGVSYGYNFSPSFYTHGYRPGFYHSFPGGYTYTPPSYFVAPYYGPSLYGGYGYGYSGW